MNKPNLFVVDGKSSDRTLELARDQGAEVIIQNGKGNAISEGLYQLNGDTAYGFLLMPISLILLNILRK